ncbi:hypothetical protein H0H92_015511, partial [Tricholoma furcatifolium]
MPAWLSVPTVTFVGFRPLFFISLLTNSTPNNCPTHSPSYTVCSSSLPSLSRNTLGFSKPLNNTAAAPIFPLYPDPSVYTLTSALFPHSLSIASSFVAS